MPDEPFAQHGRLEYYRNAAGEWAWRVRSIHNGKITGQGEGYHNKADMFGTLEWMFPGVRPVEVPTWTVEDFEPDHTAPAGDPDLDCTGEPDGAS